MGKQVVDESLKLNRHVPSPTLRRLCKPDQLVIHSPFWLAVFLPTCTPAQSTYASINSDAAQSAVAEAFAGHTGHATHPSLLTNQASPIRPLRSTAFHRAPSKTVFGFLPYWGNSSHLRYDLLTHIACAGVEVNEDGTLGNDHGWPWTGVINTAHGNGVRIILVATLFDSSSIYNLINDAQAKATFFADIHSKMLEGSADGLNIDFEGGGTQWQPLMPSFMAELTSYLHNVQPGSEVTVDGPAVNWSNAWDLNALAESCDGVFIMGYDFWGSWSSTSGPVAPLTGGSFNITNTVQSQYAGVLPANRNKLILGVPYYGAHWTTGSSAARSTTTGWVGSITYASAMPQAQLHGLQWDHTSQTPWYRWHDGVNWHQVWFDNETSIGLKIDLALNSGFQGVGMWALGYDGDRDELWNVIESRLITQSAPTIPTLSSIGMICMTSAVLLAGVVLIRRTIPTTQAP